MPSRSRIMVYLPEDKLEEIKKWAQEQNRSVSNLAATIILEALENRAKGAPPPTVGGGDS
ncbi:MAG: hypothetical protein F6K14_33580 [Symploca sp. SIO2C1]|nr:hypothetical protein [Symploca sp. SIO2C1]